MSNLIIIGTGGHAGVVIDALQMGSTKEHITTLEEGDAIKNSHPNQNAFIAIGDNAARERISGHPFNFINVRHPLACIWKVSCIGTYFGANSVIGNNSKVGNFCIINTGAILEHDSVVGDFTHLAPGVVTGGRVRIGSRTTIGLGAIIRDGVTIGDNCVIGMASCVLRDISNDSIVYGNPATIRGGKNEPRQS